MLRRRRAFGIAFNLGVAHALRDGGIAVEEGPMMGTSAGSWTAAALATGLTLDDLIPTWTTSGAGCCRQGATGSPTSSSLPGFARPHVIDGRHYVDGGLLSGTSAARAPRAGMLVVTAPMAGPLLGTVGGFGDRMTRMETARWCLLNGRRALYVRPDRRFRPYLNRLGDIVAVRGIDDVYSKAYDLGTERLAISRARDRRARPGAWAA